MVDVSGVTAETEPCIVAPEIAEDVAENIGFELGDETALEPVAAETGEQQPPAELAPEAQLDLDDGMDGYFGMLDVENSSRTLTFSPSEDGLVDVIIASSFGDASTHLEIHDQSGDLVAASETEGLEGFQTVSFAGKADQIYELTISSDTGVSGSFQVTVGVEANNESGVSEVSEVSMDETNSDADAETNPDAEAGTETDLLDSENSAIDTEPVTGEESDNDSISIEQPTIVEDVESGDEIADEVVEENVGDTEEVATDEAENDNSADSELEDEAADTTDELVETEAEPANEPANESAEENSNEVLDDVSDEVETIADIVDSVVDTIVDELEETGHDFEDFDLELTPVNSSDEETVAEFPSSEVADEVTASDNVDSETEQPVSETEVTDSVTVVLDDDSSDEEGEFVNIEADTSSDDETETNQTDTSESNSEVTAETGESDGGTSTEVIVDQPSATDDNPTEGNSAEDDPTDDQPSTDGDDVTDNETEPSDQHADEIGPSATELTFTDGVAELSGELETVDDTDAFRFTANADGNVELYVGEPVGESNLDVQVVDSQGNLVVDGATNEAVKISFDAEAGTEYFVIINSDADQQGTYNLLVEAPEAMAESFDDHTDTVGADATLIETVDGVGQATGELEVGQDTDVFRVVASSEGDISVSLDVESENHISDASITVTDGDTVVASGTTNDLVGLRFDTTAGTEFQFQIESVNDEVLNYQLTINELASPTDPIDGTADENTDDFVSDEGEADSDREVSDVDTSAQSNGSEEQFENSDDINLAETDSDGEAGSELDAVDDLFAEDEFQWAFSFDGDRFYSRLNRG